MPVIDMQRRQSEVGRIRLGRKIEIAKGKSRPAKLETLRFTSPRKIQIERIAALYGGKVAPWTPDRGGPQWEVITDATEVPVVIPQQDPADSQYFEDWTAGGCVRRCNGVRELLGDTKCLCDPDPLLRKCKLHTRLHVMLADVIGLGVWRIDTSSYYAALELPGVAELLAMAGGAIGGKLILDPRSVVRGGKTKRFAVPVLDVDDITPRQLVDGQVPAITAKRRADALAAVNGEPATAITAGPNWELLISTAPTVDALRGLYAQIEDDAEDGEVPDGLRALFTARKEAILADAAQASAVEEEPLVDDEVIDAEIVPAEEYKPGPPISADEWPEPRQPGSGGAR